MPEARARNAAKPATPTTYGLTAPKMRKTRPDAKQEGTNLQSAAADVPTRRPGAERGNPAAAPAQQRAAGKPATPVKPAADAPPSADIGAMGIPAKSQTRRRSLRLAQQPVPNEHADDDCPASSTRHQASAEPDGLRCVRLVQFDVGCVVSLRSCRSREPLPEFFHLTGPTPRRPRSRRLWSPHIASAR